MKICFSLIFMFFSSVKDKKLENLKKFGIVREVRGKGILRGVELVKDTKTKAPFPELGNALKRAALENGSTRT